MLKETKEIQSQILHYNHARTKLAQANKLIRRMGPSVKRHKFRRGQTLELMTICRGILCAVNHIDFLAAGNPLPVVGDGK